MLEGTIGKKSLAHALVSRSKRSLSLKTRTVQALVLIRLQGKRMISVFGNKNKARTPFERDETKKKKNVEYQSSCTEFASVNI
jgi:hypothetical protein